MKLIGRNKLQRVSDEVDRWLRSWCAEVAHAYWQRPEDITDQFPNARMHSGGAFLFPIGTSGYCVILQVAFKQGVALILEMSNIDISYER